MSVPSPTTVSVVLPVFNGEALLGRAIDSVRAQTTAGWRLIIVDDGSTDGSRQVAARYASTDPRITVVTRENGGLSSARNTGLQAVGSDWVLFLDHDDWLAPSAIQSLQTFGSRSPDAACIFGGWTIVRADGTSEARAARIGDTLDMATVALRCPFPVHCAITRTAAVRAVGGFDPGLEACEDWDLWSRLIRAGIRFAQHPDPLAYYHLSPGSMSTSHRMLTGGLKVIARIFSSDPRVTEPVPAFRDGAPAHLRAEVEVAWAGYAAGLAIGAGRSASEMVAVLATRRAAADASVETISYELYDAVTRARGAGASAWWRLPPGPIARLEEFLAGLEEALGNGAISRRLTRALEELAGAQPLDPCAVSTARLGRTLSVAVELSEPAGDICVGSGVDRLQCRPAWRGQPLTAVTLAVSDGYAPAGVVLDACCAANAWPLAQALLRETREDRPAALAGDGWEAFLQEAWGCRDWPEDAFYDPEWEMAQPLEEVSAAGQTHAVVLDVCHGPPRQAWRLDPNGDDGLEVELRVAGEPCLRVRVASRRGQVTGAAAVAAIDGHAGFELCRAVVRRAVPHAGRAPVGLRQALLAARTVASGGTAVEGGTGVEPRLGQRPAATPGTAGFRAAMLPGETGEELIAVARRLGEPVAPASTPSTPPLRQRSVGVMYDPTLLSDSRPARRPSREPTDSARWDVPASPHNAVPILMYHRVAPNGSSALRRWRVTPDELDEQLSYLRSSGYRSISLQNWRDAVIRRRPLPGRAVVLTFDDGYADFDVHARPLLERHGFTASLFVVTDRVGAVNAWDSETEEIRLMDWKTLRRLDARGFEIGAHTATHPPLTALDDAQVVREVARSRQTLAERLGRSPVVFAAPYGLRDPGIDGLIGACGFELAVTCRYAHATFDDPLLRMPRLEVAGGLDPAGFGRLLDP